MIYEIAEKIGGEVVTENNHSYIKTNKGNVHCGIMGNVYLIRPGSGNRVFLGYVRDGFVTIVNRFNMI